MPFDSNLRNTLLFLAIFILAFFPNLFQLLLYPILLPFSYLGADFLPSTRPALLPTCNCCPPAACNVASLKTHPAATVAKAEAAGTMSWFQKQFTLPSKARGSYLITSIVEKEVPEIAAYKVGILHLFMQHTSAGLSLNENWDSEVRLRYSRLYHCASTSRGTDAMCRSFTGQRRHV